MHFTIEAIHESKSIVWNTTEMVADGLYNNISGEAYQTFKKFILGLSSITN
jgi:hypothetical protein